MAKGHQTFAILFHLNKQRSKNKKPAIYMRITVDCKRQEIATPHHVDALLWDPKAQCVNGKTEAAKTVNQQLTIMKPDLYRHYSIFLSMGKPITAELLKNAYAGLGEKQKTLGEVFDIHNFRFEERVKAGIKSPVSLKRMKITKDKVKAFLHHNYQLSDKQLTDLKSSFISDFEHFLITVQGMCHNTANKYLKILKQVLKMSVDQGWISSSPFSAFKCKYEETQRERLTMAEIMDLYEKDMHCDRLNEVRDVYLFCCFTGFAYQDVFNLTTDHMVNGIDGEKWIMKNREKTDSPERVPLLPIPLEIIEKYKNHPYRKNSGRLLPVNSNQRYNAYLKEVAVIGGIKKYLTTHTARHTFATTVTLEHDVPIETVSQMLGHRNIKTTQLYAKITQTKISNNMKALKNRLNEIKLETIQNFK